MAKKKKLEETVEKEQENFENSKQPKSSEEDSGDLNADATAKSNEKEEKETKEEYLEALEKESVSEEKKEENSSEEKEKKEAKPVAVKVGKSVFLGRFLFRVKPLRDFGDYILLDLKKEEAEPKESDIALDWGSLILEIKADSFDSFDTGDRIHIAITAQKTINNPDLYFGTMRFTVLYKKQEGDKKNKTFTLGLEALTVKEEKPKEGEKAKEILLGNYNKNTISVSGDQRSKVYQDQIFIMDLYGVEEIDPEQSNLDSFIKK
jgi:hypothetical protein